MAVELQYGCRLSTLVDPSPAVCGNVFQRTVQQYALGMRIVLALVVWQAAYLGIFRQSLQMAVNEHVAVVLLRVPNPHEGPTAGDGAMVEERWTASQDGIASTVYPTVHPVAAAIGLQGIAVANDVDVLKEIALPVHQQSLSLPLAVSLQRQVTEREVAAIVGSKGGTTRREGSPHLVGLDVGGVGIKHLVVRIVNQYPLATLALDGDKPLVAEIHQFLVVAVLHHDAIAVLSRGNRVGDKVQCALNGREVAFAVGRDCQQSQVAVGCLFLRAERPALFPLDAVEALDHTLVDGDVIVVAILQHVMMQIDGQLPAVGDDGVEMEAIGEAADDVELIAARVPRIHARGCASLGVAVGDVLRLISIRYGRILCRRIIRLTLCRPRRNTHVQAVDQLACLLVIDRDKAPLSDRGVITHRHRQVSVNIHIRRTVLREQSGNRVLCLAKAYRVGQYAQRHQPFFHHCMHYRNKKQLRKIVTA